MNNSCNAYNSCKGMSRIGRKDIEPNHKFKKVMQEYGEGTLKSSSGQQVNSRQQALAIAASESGQSYNDNLKKFKKADRFGMRNRGQK